jgi:phage N-6-adenine-methyltransferase
VPRPRIYASNAERQAAYRQRKRKRQPVLFWHKADVWETPPELFAAFDREFHFTTDVAALPHNAKCPHFFTPGQDALVQKWEGTCWMNPPYGPGLRKWVSKAFQSAQDGATVVCLLPARTDTHWWHDYVLPHAEIRYIRGRLRFNGIGNSAPFPSAVAVFRPAHEGQAAPQAGRGVCQIPPISF